MFTALTVLLASLCCAQQNTSHWGITTSYGVKHDFSRFASSNFSPFGFTKLKVIYENSLVNRMGFGMQVSGGYCVDKTRFRLNGGSIFTVRQRMAEVSLLITVPLKNKSIKPYAGLSGSFILGTDYSIFEYHNGNDPNPTNMQFNIERAQDSINSSIPNFVPGIIIGCSFRIAKTLYVDVNFQHIPLQVFASENPLPYTSNSQYYSLPVNYRPTYLNVGITWFFKKASAAPVQLSD
jgi:hypothetical protein